MSKAAIEKKQGDVFVGKEAALLFQLLCLALQKQPAATVQVYFMGT
jgi:hypothetical protein